MKHIGTLIAVAVTAAIMLAIGVFSVLPAPESSAAPVGDGATADAAPAVQASASAADPGAIQAAFAAREALVQSQIMALDQELTAREADYAARADELATVIATGDAQLALLQQQEAELTQQLGDLLVAQADRTTVYETQRGQAYSQYQVNLQQLQAQLDEATLKLAEARARLGQ